MSTVASTALSGMRAALASQQSAAHNIANSSTPAFKRQQTVRTEDPAGGVRTQITQATQEGSDLAADMIEQMNARHSFAANLQVFKTHDRMAGALLDDRA